MATLPTLRFAVIGAGKCGTTALYRLLSAHPQVCLPLGIKETNFFALRGLSLTNAAAAPDDTQHWPEAVTDDNEWAALFAHAKPNQRLGEVCPMYLYSRTALDNLQRDQPNIRLVVILRDPVARLWSRHQHLERDGRGVGAFEEALDRTSIWWRRDDLVREGFYAANLQMVWDRFPRDQVLVLQHQNLLHRQTDTLRTLCDFIGIDAALLPTMPTANRGGAIRSIWLQRFVGRNGFVGLLRNLLPAQLSHYAAMAPLVRFVRLMRQANLRPQAPAGATRRRLIDEVYRPQVDRLESMLGWELDHWKE